MFHRKHVARFVDVLNSTMADFSLEDGDRIMMRAEEAAAKFSSRAEGNFSGGSLKEVLGTERLVEIFSNMWERQHAVLNP